ncbi:MAG: Lipoprotein-releasing system ATP-binding protein LolD [Candidatus Hydrogenedentes bacterium ADurb.Bin179]|nr:MAG: Lipoprotein-releasing system ATP-binding protein LolD [Candidatus Hydrogenedentes bacterium ADurb.Bin179]
MKEQHPLLELAGVVKEYPARPAPLRVLNGIDFTLRAGESAAIVGPSGCGKSTLLNLMGTLDRPDTGVIRILGRDCAAMDGRTLARLRNERIGFVFQLHHLLPQCTVFENILVPSLVRSRRHREEAGQRASALLARMGLGERRDHRPGELSGGECQRTAVARALINDPALLLADEPTGALNEAAADALAGLLLELRDERSMAVVIVTHARSIARRFGIVYTLEHGCLVREE